MCRGCIAPSPVTIFTEMLHLHTNLVPAIELPQEMV